MYRVRRVVSYRWSMPNHVDFIIKRVSLKKLLLNQVVSKAKEDQSEKKGLLYENDKN